jgi:hypothetical protein
MKKQILGVLFVLVVIYCVIKFAEVGLRISDPPSSANVANTSPQFRLVSSRPDRRSGSNNVLIHGEVQNTSDIPAEQVQAVASFYDKNGNFLKSAHGYASLTPLAPGKVSPFTILLVGHDDFATYKIDFK